MNPTPEQLRDAMKQALANLEPEVRGTERHYVVRAAHGQFPVQWNLRATATSTPKPRPPTEGDPASRAVGDEPQVGDMVAVVGTASSTSVDWYGTEMSPACLQAMAQQFAAGVGCYPSHGGGFFGPGLGWDDEMGRTSAAELERANVADPADATEPGWVCKVTMDLDATDSKVQSLCKRLARSQPIGLSIGGWFTEVRYITDENGELLRIIVEAVELDHLAVVRNPANPDCLGLEMLRSAGADTMRARVQAGLAALTLAGPTDAAPVPVPEPDGADAPQAPAHVVPVEARSVPTPDTGNPPEVTTPPVLDTGSPQSHDRSATAPVDGADHPEDAPMLTPEQLAVAIREALSPLTQRLDAIEAQRAAPATPAAPAADPTPAPTAGDTVLLARVQALEATAARQRTVIANLSAQPQRHGGGARVALAASNSPTYSGEIGALLKRCEAEGDDHAMALREVVTRHQPMLSVKFRSKGAEGQKLREACDNAEEMLREICVAADADGTLGDWRRLHV